MAYLLPQLGHHGFGLFQLILVLCDALRFFLAAKKKRKKKLVTGMNIQHPALTWLKIHLLY